MGGRFREGYAPPLASPPHIPPQGGGGRYQGRLGVLKSEDLQGLLQFKPVLYFAPLLTGPFMRATYGVTRCVGG